MYFKYFNIKLFFSNVLLKFLFGSKEWFSVKNITLLNDVNTNL